MPSSSGWFSRGGNYSNGANAGIFNFDVGRAGGSVNDGARAVLLQNYNEMPFGDNKIRMKIILRSFLPLDLFEWLVQSRRRVFEWC